MHIICYVVRRDWRCAPLRRSTDGAQLSKTARPPINGRNRKGPLQNQAQSDRAACSADRDSRGIRPVSAGISVPSRRADAVRLRRAGCAHAARTRERGRARAVMPLAFRSPWQRNIMLDRTCFAWRHRPASRGFFWRPSRSRIAPRTSSHLLAWSPCSRADPGVPPRPQPAGIVAPQADERPACGARMHRITHYRRIESGIEATGLDAGCPLPGRRRARGVRRTARHVHAGQRDAVDSGACGRRAGSRRARAKRSSVFIPRNCRLVAPLVRSTAMPALGFAPAPATFSAGRTSPR